MSKAGVLRFIFFAALGSVVSGCGPEESDGVISTVPRTNNPRMIEDPYRSPYPLARM